MDFDLDGLIAGILAALKAEVSEGWATIEAFSADQARMLANQAKMIAVARRDGSLKDDDHAFNFFTEQMKRLAENFARTVAALSVLTLERAWNAVVGVVWDTVNAFLGAAGLGAAPEPPSI